MPDSKDSAGLHHGDVLHRSLRDTACTDITTPSQVISTCAFNLEAYPQTLVRDGKVSSKTPASHPCFQARKRRVAVPSPRLQSNVSAANCRIEQKEASQACTKPQLSARFMVEMPEALITN